MFERSTTLRTCFGLLASAGFATAGSAAAAELVDLVQRNDAVAAIAQIEKGADANTPSVDGTTPLHWAVHNDNLDLVERLVDAGANVNASNTYGATPLTEAA